MSRPCSGRHRGVYGGYVAALVCTGVRAGEVTALRLDDVDLERCVIRVSRSLSPGKHGELVEQSPMSHKSREVPLIAALRPYAEQAARGTRSDELLFAGPSAGPPVSVLRPRTGVAPGADMAKVGPTSRSGGWCARRRRGDVEGSSGTFGPCRVSQEVYIWA